MDSDYLEKDKPSEGAIIEFDELFSRIMPILAERGIKRCTMDLVASELGISKRTLYENFESKEDMLKRLLTRMHEINHVESVKLFRESSNMMEAMARHAFATQRSIERFSPLFFEDLSRYPFMRAHIESKQEEVLQQIRKLVATGIEQGVFRPDVNYEVTLRLVHIQHESLSRMSELFPPEITLAEAHEAITIGFLRSIATPKGMNILDELTDRLRK